MATVDQSIDADVPVFVGCIRWARFETVPLYLPSVEDRS
jgi:hypothetical protein